MRAFSELAKEEEEEEVVLPLFRGITNLPTDLGKEVKIRDLQKDVKYYRIFQIIVGLRVSGPPPPTFSITQFEFDHIDKGVIKTKRSGSDFIFDNTSRVFAIKKSNIKAATTQLDPNLLPYLFKVGTGARNEIHAVFIALCHQLYFAAQVNRKMKNKDPLPSIEKGRQVWFPLLQEEIRASNSTAYFGIPRVPWSKWFDSIRKGWPVQLDALVDLLKKDCSEIRTHLSSLKNIIEDEEGGALEIDTETFVEGDVERKTPRNFFNEMATKLQLRPFLENYMGPKGFIYLRAIKSILKKRRQGLRGQRSQLIQKPPLLTL